MQFVKASPSQYLVVGEHGKTRNLGIAASAYLWRRSTYVLIPSTQQEANFEMTQESSDGVPLRFKGIVIYRISDPEIASKRFNFSGVDGCGEINSLINHVCLGELRAVISQMKMQECIEGRKTTLTDAIASELKKVVEDEDEKGGWWIELDVVQVAQVYIVDDELRQQLEAEVRNEIKSKSDLSDIQLQEEVELAQVSSKRKLNQASLETERQRAKIAQEKLLLEKELEREKIETEAPLRLLHIEKEREIIQQEIELRQLENQAKELEVHNEMLLEKAKLDLQKEILPIEQVPAIAESVSKMFQGANLSVYGEASPIFSSVGPLVEILANTLREIGSEKKASGE